MKKTERLNGVIFSLNERGRLTAKQLSEIFEVSERTIYRDIDALSQLKVPIISYDGLNGGYEIEDDYFIPSIKLNEDEVILLLIVLKLGSDINFPNYKSDYELLRSKIVNTLKKSERNDAETLIKHLSFYVSSIIPKKYSDGIFNAIVIAIIEKRQLQFVYYTPASDKHMKRQVSCQELFFEGGGWYLAAHCHLRKEKRVFRLDRMSDILVLDDMNEHMAQVIIGVTDKFAPCMYTLEIEKGMFRLLKNNDYFKEIKILTHSESMLIEVTTTLEDEITKIVLGNPNEITVLGPSDYVSKMGHIVHQLKNKYN